MVDNGYHKWACLIPPHKFPSTRDDVLWSEWVESVRKDVECFFGKLKARWQFLKVANRCHSAKTIEKAFECCCIIHNKLLDQSAGKQEDADDALEAHLDALDPNQNDPSEEAWEQEDVVLGEAGARKKIRPPDEPQAELSMFNYKTFATIRGAHFGAGCMDFDKLRRALTNSFLIQYYKGEVSWPQRMLRRRENGAKSKGVHLARH